jgi:hypothetical protein
LSTSLSLPTPRSMLTGLTGSEVCHLLMSLQR